MRASWALALISAVLFLGWCGSAPASVLAAPAAAKSASPEKCAAVLSSTASLSKDIAAVTGGETATPTENFVGYLGLLLDNQVIGQAHLERLVAGLRRGELVNPISDEEARVSSSLQIHREGLEEVLGESEIDRDEVLRWAEENLKEKARVRVRREETRGETEDLHWQKMVFNRVEPGTFIMGEGDKTLTVTLTKAYELMSTLVTQMQWAMIMGRNPSVFAQGPYTITFTIDGKPIKMQPDNPVEQVSWDDVQRFVDKLNKLSRDDDPRLYKLIPDHQKGDQYRLPTEAEWEFVGTVRAKAKINLITKMFRLIEKMRGKAKTNGKFHFGDDKSELKNRAWYAENSGQTTNPVGELKGLEFNDKVFYDLLGNVWEWVEDSYILKLPPKVSKKGSFRVIRGGSFDSDEESLRFDKRGGGDAQSGYSYVGFRLVRVRP
jgi:formylglycine-generating enzyme required for sulfatase activity